MDRNPMLQGGYNQQATAGGVPGKVMLDWVLIREGMANAEDPTVNMFCYPGGSKEINHDAMPMMLSFGLRSVRNEGMGVGEPNELGITSLAGLYAGGFASHRDMEDSFYCQGVVQTEQRVSAPMDDNRAQDPDHGYAILRAGTCSIINNGPYMFYPGQYICWRFPAGPRSTYSLDTVATPDGSVLPEPGFLDPDTFVAGEGFINQRARGGQPATQWLPQVVPFDYTDFTAQISAAYEAIKVSRNDPSSPGVSDILFREFFARGGTPETHNLSACQEDAGGYKYGDLAKVLAGVEALAAAGFLTIVGAGAVRQPVAAGAGMVALAQRVRDLSTEIGMWSTNVDEQGVLRSILANIYFPDLLHDEVVSNWATHFEAAFLAQPGDVMSARQALTRINLDNDPTANYRQLRLSVTRLSEGARSGAYFSKTSKIIGRAIGYAAQQDTLPALIGNSII